MIADHAFGLRKDQRLRDELGRSDLLLGIVAPGVVVADGSLDGDLSASPLVLCVQRVVSHARVREVRPRQLRELIRHAVVDPVFEVGVVAVRGSLVPVEHALIAGLHVVCAGDVGRRRLPAVRFHVVGVPHLRAIDQAGYAATVVRATSRALFRHANQVAIVARHFAPVPILVVRAVARVQQKPARDGPGPLVLKHRRASTSTDSAGLRRGQRDCPDLANLRVITESERSGIDKDSHLHAAIELRGQSKRRSDRTRRAVIRRASEVRIVGPLGDVAGVLVVEDARQIVPAPQYLVA